MLTIEYDDELYELYEERKGVAPRPHIYQLRKLSPGGVVRGIHPYHPCEALTERQRISLAKQPAEEERK